jgi:hypothetical protein
MTTDNEELWYVQMDSGELRELTLDELDEAFNAGLIHENTFVMEVGGTEWQTLADVAGLNEEEPPAAPAPVYAPQAAGPARPLPQLAPQGGSQWPPATSAAMNASAWPPVVAATPAYAPRLAPAAMPYNLGPQSTAPVVHDLSDLDLNPPFKKRGMGKWVAAVAVLVLGGAGFAATQMKMMPRFAFTAPKAPVEVTAAMTMPKAPEPTPVATTPPAPTPPPVTTTAKEEKKEEKAEDGKAKSLTEEMKEKLLESDKTRAKERKSKRTARASKASKRSGGRGKKGDSGGPFRGGGSSSDPLNSKL